MGGTSGPGGLCHLEHPRHSTGLGDPPRRHHGLGGAVCGDRLGGTEQHPVWGGQGTPPCPPRQTHVPTGSLAGCPQGSRSLLRKQAGAGGGFKPEPNWGGAGGLIPGSGGAAVPLGGTRFKTRRVFRGSTNTGCSEQKPCGGDTGGDTGGTWDMRPLCPPHHAPVSPPVCVVGGGVAMGWEQCRAGGGETKNYSTFLPPAAPCCVVPWGCHHGVCVPPPGQTPRQPHGDGGGHPKIIIPPSARSSLLTQVRVPWGCHHGVCVSPPGTNTQAAPWG